MCAGWMGGQAGEWEDIWMSGRLQGPGRSHVHRGEGRAELYVWECPSESEDTHQVAAQGQLSDVRIHPEGTAEQHKAGRLYGELI